jgi:hypothetical protein
MLPRLVVTAKTEVSHGLESEATAGVNFVVVGYVPDDVPAEMRGLPMASHHPANIIILPLSQNSTTGSEIDFAVYMPFGPLKVDIALHKLDTTVPEPSTNTRIVHIVADEFKVHSERRRMHWLTPPHIGNLRKTHFPLHAIMQEEHLPKEATPSSHTQISERSFTHITGRPALTPLPAKIRGASTIQLMRMVIARFVHSQAVSLILPLATTVAWASRLTCALQARTWTMLDCCAFHPASRDIRALRGPAGRSAQARKRCGPSGPCSH